MNGDVRLRLRLRLEDGDGDLIADAIAEEDYSFLPDGDLRGLHLVWLGVAPDHQRKGYGTTLFETVRTFAEEQRFDFVYGWHAGANSPVRACLRKLGWCLLDEGDIDAGVLPTRWPFIHIRPVRRPIKAITPDVLDKLQTRASEINRRGGTE